VAEKYNNSKINGSNLVDKNRHFSSIGSQGGQVGYSPDFHPGGPGSTPAWSNQQKKKKNHLVCLINDLMLQKILTKYFF